MIRFYIAIFIKLSYPVFCLFGPKNMYCPCCGWRGSFFMPYIDRGYVNFNYVCPACKSQARHRGHVMFYRKYYKDISGCLLYIAPEKNVDYFRANHKLSVFTSNYPDKGNSDFCFDLCNIASNDNMFDFIICNHVLEHVSDDRKALQELYRILKPGGVLILSVPINFSLNETKKHNKPDPSHTYHFYLYGKDFISRIPSVFTIEEYDFKSLFTQHEYQAIRLSDDKIFVCKK